MIIELKTAIWPIVSSQQMLAVITHRTDARVKRDTILEIAEGIQQPPFLFSFVFAELFPAFFFFFF